MTAAAADNDSDVEDAWIDEVNCGFDDDGGLLAADNDCIYTITPDTRQPTADERAAAVRSVAAACPAQESTCDISD